MRFYRLKADKAASATGDIIATSRWGLPGSECPVCGAIWASAGTAYPCVDLSDHPLRAALEKPRAEPIEEFERLRESVRPWLPPGVPIPPGTRLGPLVGTARGNFGAFFFQNPWTLLARREAAEQLLAHGVRSLKGCSPELRFAPKKNPPELLELQLPPLARLHEDCLPQRPPPCARCGRDGFELPKNLLLDASSLPPGEELFRLSNFATVLVGSERFKDAVHHLGLDGIEFHELALR
ncbi:double-CXXCG motif protein [Stigmatella erecta]|uniref:Myxococcus xanthus double-CXXCG motif paralogous family n=1 Tax=Stigmatella erecta TaxID=83460 RepID=A0A1I0GV13_9BACT|nr:double-CXXCG motif protein [Stigmatella erecta]SET75214.1 Myxococcus xanthus double-CXXCG motif paralogous family [Stigmatella erecta]